MLIMKSKISSVIKKERAKERAECLKKSQEELKKKTSALVKSYEEKIKLLNKNFALTLKEKSKEVDHLKSEIDKKHKEYQALRLREKNLDDLSAEFQHLIEEFGIRVQEAIQPFYRSQAKISLMKRRSDKEHEKMNKIFRKSDGAKL